MAPFRLSIHPLRGCTERGKTAERKKQEEETGKEEPPKEMQYE
jgi:hypothetical protein